MAAAEQRETPVITGLPIGRVGKYCTLIVELLVFPVQSFSLQLIFVNGLGMRQVSARWLVLSITYQPSHVTISNWPRNATLQN